MANLPSNILQQVQTYQMSGLAFIQNSFCGIHLANKKFQNFQNFSGNLGDTVTFELPPRYNVQNSLVVSFQDTVQRVQSLTVSQQANVAYAFSAQQFIFNVEEYMERIGKAAIVRLGNQIETNLLANFVSGVVNPTTNIREIQSGPFRFFGSPSTPINSFGQLATALARFNDFGSVPDKIVGILPLVNVPAIIETGLNQFATGRNNEIAMSWELGPFANCTWYQSNLLPVQIAGTVGNSAQTLTVISTNDPTGLNVTQITASGATANDVNAVKAGDLFQFKDNVVGFPNMRFLNFTAYNTTAQPVQFVATADAAANGSGNVTISLRTITNVGLVSNSSSANVNINNVVQAGMQLTALASHRAGIIYSGDALFMAMPQLPDQDPFKTASRVDPDSGASIRNYYGARFGQNEQGYVNDAIWGSTLVPENSMRLIFPL